MNTTTVAAEVAALDAASREAGIRPEEIAAAIGVSTRTLARWIAGKGRPRRGDLRAWMEMVAERKDGNPR